MAPSPPLPGAPDGLPPPDSYLTLAGPAEAELKVQRSRFIAIAAPAGDEAAARHLIDELARRWHDARHVCHAWRLGEPPAATEVRHDDGEPNGTAGEPILAEIRKRELIRTVVVVVRYFGGIKLGTGGLARAYGHAASDALDQAPVRTVALGREFCLDFPYPRLKTLTRLLERHAGQVRQESYGVDVGWCIWLPHSQCAPFAAALQEATAGAIELRLRP
jgi:uncharacterized YigZ family protein